MIYRKNKNYSSKNRLLFRHHVNNHIKMNSREAKELVCDISFKKLVREGKSVQGYITKNNKNIVQEAIEVIQFLDAQQTICTSDLIEHNYNGVLEKILFHKD